MTITVYSTPGCVQCTATYRALDKAGLTYTVVDVAANAAARAYVSEDLGYTRAPVVVVDDHDHWSGFRPDQITRVAQHVTVGGQTDLTGTADRPTHAKESTRD